MAALTPDRIFSASLCRPAEAFPRRLDGLRFASYLRLQMAEIDDETDDDLEDIEIEHDCYDDVMLSGEVCDVMHKENQPLLTERRLAALRPALTAIARVLAFAKELFIGHRRLVRMRDPHVFDVVIVIRHADHHLRRLA